ncbi:cupredoxin domain-containing protein [Patescibacteria group bacterium]|nr:cupredoxin domain-containing protein [Patescibacteria group bacterium]
MKSTTISIVFAGLLIAGAIFYTGASSTPGSSGTPVANNVSVVNGTQIVEISVRGGYHPQRSQAKAGIPTVLRFETNGSFDCSSSVRIPSLGIAQSLPSSGNTDISAGTPSAGVLRGTCGMGMYSFEIGFS